LAVISLVIIARKLTTIGTLGADKRRAAALYEFDLGALGL
jgi:hypothetical protein